MTHTSAIRLLKSPLACLGLLAGLLPALAAAQTPYPASCDEWNRPGTLQGISYEPESTADAATRAALRDAQEALLPRLRDVTTAAAKQRLAKDRRASSSTAHALPGDDTLRQVIAAELAGESLVLDKKLDQQRKSYGDVYYAAVLVDARPQRLESMAGRALAAAGAATQRNHAAAGSTAALLAVIVLVYVGANVLTRGYYRWRLRMLAAGASVAGMAMVVGLYYGL